jgi:hypothetical protein
MHLMDPSAPKKDGKRPKQKLSAVRSLKKTPATLIGWPTALSPEAEGGGITMEELLGMPPAEEGQ